jgi:UDP-N-acetylmuramoyl-tripeptide--D-alanyl-D-alanine ligase
MDSSYPTINLNGISYPDPDGDPMWIDHPQIIWTAHDLAKATGGRWVQGDTSHLTMNGVCYYRSQIRAGDLFIARNPKQWRLSKIKSITKKGIQKAMGQGAVAVILHEIPDGLPEDIPVLLVSDTQQALFDIGYYARRRFTGKTICITGSVGKTTTKEMIRYLLAHVEPTVGSRANFNTISGICLSLAQTAYNMSYGVYEFAVGAPNRTLMKAKICKPNIAIVTEIYEAHLSHYKTIDRLVQQKALLFDGLCPDGTVILNRDSDHYQRLAEIAIEKGVKHIVTYGSAQGSDIFLKKYSMSDIGSDVEIIIDDETLKYYIPVPGFHNIKNSLAALATIKVTNEDLQTAAENLSNFKSVRNRTNYHEVKLKEGNFTIIDDVYNANPGSINAGLKLISLIEGNTGRRKVIVLGQMKKPGDESARLHRELSIPLMNLGVDKVYTLGADMLHLRNALPKELRGSHGEHYEEIADDLANDVRTGDIVFLKGPSPSPQNTKKLVDVLTALDTTIASEIT